MILKKLSERIYYLEHERETDRPQLILIQGDHTSVMIDCGNSKKHLELFYAGVKEAGLTAPQFALITHWHWDHTFGMHSFHGTTIASRKTNEHLKRMASYLEILRGLDFDTYMMGHEDPMEKSRILKELGEFEADHETN